MEKKLNFACAIVALGSTIDLAVNWHDSNITGLLVILSCASALYLGMRYWPFAKK